LEPNLLTSLDLFSCIGCHAIGMERAGIKTVGLCEVSPWRRARLAERFPETPLYEDVRTFNGAYANIIVGGPPCQRTSVAAAIHGRRDGESLWPHMLRIGVNVGAEWFVVEQPPGNAAWEAEVANGLSRSGYHVARLEFSASDIGAPYLRRRVFLVACTSLSRLAVAWRSVPHQIKSVKRAANARGDWDPDQLQTLPVDARTADEFDFGPKSAERREWIVALGDSNPPHMAEVIGRAIAAAH
jgi:site-specific DNA-cytosine methylase